MLRKIFKHNCKHKEPLLWEYAGGRLQPEQKTRVDAHLMHCAVCRTQLQTITRVGQGLETLRQAPVPATQTHWAQVQARLAAVSVIPQPETTGRATGRNRILAGAGMAAALALLWVVLVPSGSKQPLLSADEGKNRSEKYFMSVAASKSSSTQGAAKVADDVVFDKSFLPEGAMSGLLYVPHPIAPVARLTNAFLHETDNKRNSLFTRRGRRFVSRYGFMRKRRRLLAGNERLRTQQNITMGSGNAEMFAPVVGYALNPVTPNYVLSDVEADFPTRIRRAYVMDCLATDTKSQTAEGSGQNGEERVW